MEFCKFNGVVVGKAGFVFWSLMMPGFRWCLGVVAPKLLRTRKPSLRTCLAVGCRCATTTGTMSTRRHEERRSGHPPSSASGRLRHESVIGMWRRAEHECQDLALNAWPTDPSRVRVHLRATSSRCQRRTAAPSFVDRGKTRPFVLAAAALHHPRRPSLLVRTAASSVSRRVASVGFQVDRYLGAKYTSRPSPADRQL